MTPQRSYALALRTRGSLPKGMYLSAGSPTRSIRSARHGRRELLIVAGEGHKSGWGDTSERYVALEQWASATFPVKSIEFAWAAQDPVPADALPFIGRLWPFSSRIWTATGFRKWGLAAGTAAAIMVADGIGGRENPWLDFFDPKRLGSPLALTKIAKEGAGVGTRFLGDRIAGRGSAEDLAPGEGAVVGSGLSQRAAYRDPAGELHELSARCTHLGCIVQWNSGDRSWDCPCHGSRFGTDGEVIEGPAVRPLASQSVP